MTTKRTKFDRKHGLLDYDKFNSVQRYVSPNGTVSFSYRGNLHNEGGPAVIKEDGTRYWFINGIEFSEDEYNSRPEAE
jgi:hypothetical protein